MPELNDNPFAGLGLGWNPYAGQQARAIPRIDPEDALERIALQDYRDFDRDFRPFEEGVLGSVNDTSLVDAARERAGVAGDVAAGVRDRTLSRYGREVDPNLARATGRAQGLSGTLNDVQSLSTARVRQREVNDALTADLFNIGQGIHRSALSGLSESASREAAREAAKRDRKNKWLGLIGGLFG